jgi:hypothetical protein
MGRTYLFECPRCAYRARVSGRADRGFGVCVETIVCGDCKQLYDAVVRLKLPDVKRPEPLRLGSKLAGNGSAKPNFSTGAAPTVQAALNRLNFGWSGRYKWVEFKKRCPVSPLHRVRNWTDPEKCPQCGTYLERHGLPYRIWD